MIDKSSDIYQIIENNFPMREGGHFAGDLSHPDSVETFFAGLTSNAVNRNVTRPQVFTRLLRKMAVEFLVNGNELPNSLRAWIAFVLMEIRDEDIPHRRNGRPIDEARNSENLEKLAFAILRYREKLSGTNSAIEAKSDSLLPAIMRHKAQPNICNYSVTDMLNAVCDMKPKIGEIGTIKDLYYSDDFSWLCNVLQIQEIAPKKRQAKKNGPTKGPAKKGQ